MSPAQAGRASGLSSILAMGAGAAIGGLLIRLLKVQPKGVALGILFSSFLTAICYFFLMMVRCEPRVLQSTWTPEGCVSLALYHKRNHRIREVHDTQRTMFCCPFFCRMLNVNSQCSNECQCLGKPFSPVCDESLGINYYSPCHAGCTEVVSYKGTTVRNFSINQKKPYVKSKSEPKYVNQGRFRFFHNFFPKFKTISWYQVELPGWSARFFRLSVVIIVYKNVSVCDANLSLLDFRWNTTPTVVVWPMPRIPVSRWTPTGPFRRHRPCSRPSGPVWWNRRKFFSSDPTGQALMQRLPPARWNVAFAPAVVTAFGRMSPSVRPSSSSGCCRFPATRCFLFGNVRQK